MIVTGDVIGQGIDVFVFDICDDHVAKLDTSVGESCELILCEFILADSFADLGGCCIGGVRGGHSGVDRSNKVSVGIDRIKFLLRNFT